MSARTRRNSVPSVRRCYPFPQVRVRRRSRIEQDPRRITPGFLLPMIDESHNHLVGFIANHVCSCTAHYSTPADRVQSEVAVGFSGGFFRGVLRGNVTLIGTSLVSQDGRQSAARFRPHIRTSVPDIEARWNSENKTVRFWRRMYAITVDNQQKKPRKSLDAKKNSFRDGHPCRIILSTRLFATLPGAHEVRGF